VKRREENKKKRRRTTTNALKRERDSRRRKNVHHLRSFTTRIESVLRFNSNDNFARKNNTTTLRRGDEMRSKRDER